MELEDIRLRCIRGESLTLEETRQLIATCRRGYKAAVERPAPAARKRTAASAAPKKSLDELLGGLA